MHVIVLLRAAHRNLNFAVTVTLFNVIFELI